MIDVLQPANDTNVKDANLAIPPIGGKTCSHCGTEFRPLRRSARFCGPTCRVAAHRKSGCNANSAAHTPAEPPPASQNDSEVLAGRSKLKNSSTAKKSLSVTEPSEASTRPCPLKDGGVTAPILRRSKPLPWRIVPDAKWSGMFRIQRPDGALTDMVNLTRGKDALAEIVS